VPRLIMMFKVILMEEAVFSQRHCTNPGKLTARTQCHDMSWRFGSDDFPLHMGDV